tara:strand:- start:2765 stop:3469 length:705 start_codon:yes stop_codon:yes gene_type:complete
VNNFIFDVDGTLTPSRGHINLDFAIWFSDFCNTHNVYLVTGSDKPKTIEQIGEDIYNKCKRVYQCSGSDVYEGKISILKSEWTLPMSVHSWLEDKLEESNFSIRTGNHIEQRIGMVNFSIVGRNADSIDRGKYVQYEQEHGERGIIADMFNKEFSNLQATVGGDTGIDIGPRGADKSQILRDFKENDTIHFYGDAMDDCGNDYPLANALKKFQLGFSYQVTGWEDTWNKLKDIK